MLTNCFALVFMRLSKERLLFDSVKMRFGINRSFLLENSIWNIRVGRIGLIFEYI